MVTPSQKFPKDYDFRLINFRKQPAPLPSLDQKDTGIDFLTNIQFIGCEISKGRKVGKSKEEEWHPPSRKVWI
jgi:hypothetical protein